MVEMIETAPHRACGLRWRHIWALRAGEWRTRAEIALYGRFSARRGRGSGVSPAATWRAAKSKVRFLRIMIPWAWPRHPALGAVLEAARRAEAVTWCLEP